MLSVEGLKVRYGQIEAVKGLDFTVAQGEIVTLLGANGAGPYSAETWLEGVAGRAEFALGGALRNPSANGLEVGFSLTGSEAARLELLDVSGRRLVSRDVSGLGAGSHTVRLTGAGSQPAGVYFVRLAEGSAQRAVRVVLLP